MTFRDLSNKYELKFKKHEMVYIVISVAVLVMAILYVVVIATNMNKQLTELNDRFNNATIYLDSE